MPSKMSQKIFEINLVKVVGKYEVKKLHIS